jgi:hypothetical protein
MTRFLGFLFLLFPFQVFTQISLDLALQKRQLDKHYFIEYQENNIVKITRQESGKFKYVDMSDQGNKFDKTTDDQVFDLINEDTTLYNWKYQRRKYIPVSSIYGYPLVIGDFNHNGKTDFAGSYINGPGLAKSAIVELNDDTTSKVTIYPDSVEWTLSETDVDQDGLSEINFRRHKVFDNYESTHPDSFPDTLMFSYQMWEISSSVSGETFKDLDKDGITDVLYTGDDSLPPFGQKVYVAEYDTILKHFVQRFRYAPPEWNLYLFSTGDFDEDGFQEFVTGTIHGDVYVWENTGNDSYQFIFSDTISAPNAYLTCATNDIDQNGRPEFFVGGSAYYYGVPASRVYWFEADGNNHYRKRWSIFLLGTDVLGNTVLYNYDVDKDKKDELVFCFSYVVVILKWNRLGYFDLFYLDWWENWDQEIQCVNVHTIFNDQIPSLFVGIEDWPKYPRTKSIYYSPEFHTSIIEPPDIKIKDFILYQNYPNPFNSSTAIKFQLKNPSLVTLVLYDITGKEVIRLIDNRNYYPGEHSISWDGRDQTRKEVSTGIYYYSLRSGNSRETRKLVLLR